MRLSRVNLFSFLLVVFCFESVFCFEYQLSCHNGKLKSIVTSALESSKDCKAYSDLGLENCLDSSKKNKNPKAISINMPIDGYYSNRQNDNYDKSRIEDIIAFSIKNDLDPYLVLANTIVENPPLIRSGRDYYSIMYGAIPIDAIGVADYFGCQAVTVKVNNFTKKELLSPIRAKTATIDANGRMQKLCLDDFSHGEHARLLLNCESETKCCISAKIYFSDELIEKRKRRAFKQKMQEQADKLVGDYQKKKLEGPNSVTEEDYKKLETQVMTLLYDTEPTEEDLKELGDSSDCIGLTEDQNKIVLDQAAAFYIKNKYEYAMANKTQDLSSPYEKLAMLAQAYNGYGTFGATEKMKNECLTGVNFAIAPVYGTGVADIMLNALMANSEIREIVQNKLKQKNKTELTSYLCKSFNKEGVVKVSPYGFSQLTSQFMQERSKCPKHSYQLKGLSEKGQVLPKSKGVK